MRKRTRMEFLPAVLLIGLAVQAGAVTPSAGELSAGELSAAQNWVKANFAGSLRPPFSFVYGGQPSASLLPGWKITHNAKALDGKRTRYSVLYTDPRTGLQIDAEAISYSDLPAVDWVLNIKNTGIADTPILENVQAVNTLLSSAAADTVVLDYAEGSEAKITDFQPREAALQANAPLTLAPVGGRPSDGVLPFFNLVKPDGGMMIAIGWTGQWSATFARDANGGVNIQAGMQRTHLSLHPGEQIRTPRILLLFYAGNRLRGHNLLRRTIVEYYTPTPGGQPLVPPVAASGATIGFNNVTEQNQIQGATNVAAKHLPVDTWWIDAGWSQGGFPLGMGTWTPDPTRFPNGLHPVGEAVHKLGMKLLVWFEPERVMPDTWLRKNHPDWLLAPANLPPELTYQHDWRLLNLGNPDALAWAKKTFSGLISDFGVDIYRNDFNMHPLYYWRANEASNRQGMNEIRHVEGFYDYLDTLTKEHPNLLIDNVASGGRRLDLEMTKRSIPLLRTDYLWEVTGAQCMTYGLSLWLPLEGQGAVVTTPYDFRSGMGTNMVYAFDFYAANADFWGPLADRIDEYRRLKDNFTGDFYPLTPYSTAKDVWIAWQFDRPARGQGIVQAFRRENNTTDTITVKFQGLMPGERYRVTPLDTGTVISSGGSPPRSPHDPGTAIIALGSALMTNGISLTLAQAPGSAVLSYVRVKRAHPPGWTPGGRTAKPAAKRSKQ